MGSASGVGKTTVCVGLLSQLLQAGYRSEQLAYIKPMTQCTDPQAVTMFCERNHIAHQSLGLVFKKGFTKDFIAGLTKNSDQLLEDILAMISRISTDKAIVVVDGIGNPATGSVVGVSNVDIALALAAPVLFVGQAGIGSAIDDTMLAVSFMQQQGMQNIALVYNKIQPAEQISIKQHLSKRLAELLPDIPVLDFIASHRQLNSQKKHQSAAKIWPWFVAQPCRKKNNDWRTIKQHK